MALTATVYNLAIELSDVDRSVYERIDLRIARQPSETPENMALRALAYCLEYGDGIALTEGVAAGDDPAILFRDLTGKITAWIEVGMLNPERLHRGHKQAGRAALYTDRDIRKVIRDLQSAKVYRLEDIPLYAFDARFIEQLASLIDRRTKLSISITERELYANVNGHTLHTSISEHRAG
jgi:uncharacterized protein YaeQ